MLATIPSAPTLPDIVQCRKVKPELRSWNEINCRSTHFLIFGNIIYYDYKEQEFKVKDEFA